MTELATSERVAFTTTAAAAFLDAQLPGKSPEYWQRFLRNNRRPERDPAFRIGVTTVDGIGMYERDELAKFIAFERARHLGAVKLSARAAQALEAFGVGAKDGSSTGRKLKVIGVSTQVADDDGELFVQMILDEPLRVYRLSPSEARALAYELAEAYARVVKLSEASQ